MISYSLRHFAVRCSNLSFAGDVSTFASLFLVYQLKRLLFDPLMCSVCFGFLVDWRTYVVQKYYRRMIKRRRKAAVVIQRGE